jgi:DNA-binding transcriptional regulator YiaG
MANSGKKPVNLEALSPTPEKMGQFREASDALEAAALIRSIRETARAALIRSIRETGRISQAELARRLRISQGRMSIIEKGDGPNGPTYAMLKRVARACGVTLDAGIHGEAGSDIKEHLERGVGNY